MRNQGGIRAVGGGEPMTTRIIETEPGRAALIALIQSRPLPMTVQVLKGRKRSLEQNATQQMWHAEAAAQLMDETAEEKRAYCKLHFGVAILRNEDEAFRARYDEVIRPLDYETKLKLMMVPFDFPVTRLMNTNQKKRYLDAIWNHYTSQGVQLTDPEALRWGGARKAA